MNVLSLFDGISCAKMALERAGIPIANYYASEIEPNAIKVSLRNHPLIKQLGDVKTLKLGELPKIDIIIGGSPCQDLSIAKHNGKGLEGERSGLFWHYSRIVKELKPTWFILENVASMKAKERDTITKEMGVEPIVINASLVSAQSRSRLFWTNIPNVGQPADRGIKLKDILLSTVSDKLWVKNKKFVVKKSKKGELIREGYYEPNIQGYKVYSDEGKANTLLAKGGGLGACTGLYKIGHVGDSDGQANRVYSIEGKSTNLVANAGGLGGKTGLYEIYVPDGDSTAEVRVGHDIRRRINAEGIRADEDKTITPVRRVEVRNDDKCGTLTTVMKDNLVVNLPEKRIRKLDPIECERLQGLPDDYTLGIPNTHRLRCLGNAFNVDVVAHILKFINS